MSRYLTRVLSVAHTERATSNHLHTNLFTARDLYQSHGALTFGSQEGCAGGVFFASSASKAARSSATSAATEDGGGDWATAGGGGGNDSGGDDVEYGGDGIVCVVDGVSGPCGSGADAALLPHARHRRLGRHALSCCKRAARGRFG